MDTILDFLTHEEDLFGLNEYIRSLMASIMEAVYYDSSKNKKYDMVDFETALYCVELCKEITDNFSNEIAIMITFSKNNELKLSDDKWIEFKQIIYDSSLKACSGYYKGGC